MRSLLAEFLRGFSLRTLIFLLNMVLPQLDAYHAGRQLQHLQPWTSVDLAQRQERGQPGVELVVRYGYEAFAGFYVLQLLTEGSPLLLFCEPFSGRMRVRITTLKWPGCSTWAKHHIQAFGLLKQLPNAYQPHCCAYSVKKRLAT